MEKELRSGFTTGTCAAAAAKAAALLLCQGKRLEGVHIITPKGKEADLKIWKTEAEKNFVRCTVKKDSGDDPDVTDQALICASVRRLEREEWQVSDRSLWYEEESCPGIYLTGGEGVGLVTRPGLSCPVGKHAINPVPRKMIFKEVGEAWKQRKEDTRLLVTIEIPCGRELAEKTFNPRLGITGGLSVLGTTGIVEPMSEEALLASIRLEIHMKAVEGENYIVLAPGNYGEAFLKEKKGISIETSVKCSNFIAASLRAAADEGFTRGLLAGHMGKLIKAAGGVENTHSKYGDRRMEILSASIREWMEDRKRNHKESLSEEGAKRLLGQIEVSNTTEEAAGYLKQAGIHREVGNWIAEKLRRQILQWTDHRLSMDIIIFSGESGILGEAGDNSENCSHQFY